MPHYTVEHAQKTDGVAPDAMGSSAFMEYDTAKKHFKAMIRTSPTVILRYHTKLREFVLLEFSREIFNKTLDILDGI